MLCSSGNTNGAGRIVQRQSVKKNARRQNSSVCFIIFQKIVIRNYNACCYSRFFLGKNFYNCKDKIHDTCQLLIKLLFQARIYVKSNNPVLAVKFTLICYIRCSRKINIQQCFYVCFSIYWKKVIQKYYACCYSRLFLQRNPLKVYG